MRHLEQRLVPHRLSSTPERGPDPEPGGHPRLRTVTRSRRPHRHPGARPSHPRFGRVVREHETARLHGLNGMEWGRGTGPGPSGKGKDEKHTFFFEKTGDSRCSRLDP